MKKSGDLEFLPKGMPVLIAGYAEAPFNEYGFRNTIKVAYTGRLLEPHLRGGAVLLEDGPLSRNIGARLIQSEERYRAKRPAAHFRTVEPVDGATYFILFEDREGLVAEIGAEPMPWPKPMVMAQRIGQAASDVMCEHIDLLPVVEDLS